MIILIPIAGRGTRTKDFSNLPKPLILINGKTLIERAVKSLDLKGQYIFIIREYENILWNNQLNNILNNIVKNPIIIKIDYTTDGPASSALLSKKYIDTDEELVIANGDQILKWNSSKFIEAINKNIDGLVVTWDNIAITESFIKLDKNGFGLKLKEKEIISEYPLNGIHYWKKGKYFVESVEELIRRNIRTNNEFYISETYNILIEKKYKITNHHISKQEHMPLGIASDIKKYLKEHK